MIKIHNFRGDLTDTSANDNTAHKLQSATSITFLHSYIWPVSLTDMGYISQYLLNLWGDGMIVASSEVFFKFK